MSSRASFYVLSLLLGIILIGTVSYYGYKRLKWNTDSYVYPSAKLRSLKGVLLLRLEKKPLDQNRITVRMSFPNPKVEGFRLLKEYSQDQIACRHDGSRVEVSIDMDAVNKYLKERGVTENTDILFEIVYPIK